MIRWRWLRDAGVLTALCAAAYVPGLTDHGLTNWQEGIRLLAAQEMGERGDWVTPTIHGEAYLAKPPLIYWFELAIAWARGSAGAVELVDLRLAAAIAGWLGVMSTWLCARALLREPGASGPTAEGGAVWAGRGAFWAGAMLATGVLSSRAARIGELDILLVSFTPVAVLAALGSMRASGSKRASGSMREPRSIMAGRVWAWLGWQGLGAAAFSLLALAKGPPGMLTAALAIIGGVAWGAIREARGERNPRAELAAAVAGAAAALAGVLAVRRVGSVNEAVGLVMLVGVGGGLGWAVARMARPGVLSGLIVGTLRSGWPIGAAVGLVALRAWALGVESAAGEVLTGASAGAGAGVTLSAAEKEAGDNIQLLVLDAPRQGLEVVLYGAGLGSVGAMACLAWRLKDRPRLPQGLAFAAAWVVLSVVVFGVTTRGTHRYVLPMLPGLCILGGAWLASFTRDVRPGLSGRVAGVGVGLTAVGLGVYYGFVRDAFHAERSPRDFMAAVLKAEGVDAARIGSVDTWVPSLTVYAGHPVEPYTVESAWIDYPNGAEPLRGFVERLGAEGGTSTLLIREGPEARTRLEEMGLEVVGEGRDLPSFKVDKRRTRMTYVIVRAAGGGVGGNTGGGTP